MPIPIDEKFYAIAKPQVVSASHIDHRLKPGGRNVKAEIQVPVIPGCVDNSMPRTAPLRVSKDENAANCFPLAIGQMTCLILSIRISRPHPFLQLVR